MGWPTEKIETDFGTIERPLMWTSDRVLNQDILSAHKTGISRIDERIERIERLEALVKRIATHLGIEGGNE